MELKKFIEQRNGKLEEMQKILDSVKAETRAFNEEEQKKYDSLKEDIRGLDETIKALEESEKMEMREIKQVEKQETKAETEIRTFANFIRTQKMEMRNGEQNITVGNNGAIIPTSVADMIVTKIKEISPVFARATVFRAKGNLQVPVWSDANTNHNITVDYATEFTELTADAGAFVNKTLGGYLAGALTLVSKSLINNADIDLVQFVVDEMARRFAYFIEKELLTGTGHSNNHCEGAIATTNTLNAGSTTAISFDNLLDLQMKIPQAYQSNACWIVAPATLGAIRKLKDAENRYLLQYDGSKEFPYTILGKPVFISENMPAIASANKPVLYGDFSGLAVNMHENLEIQILAEKYATQHAVGVVGYVEMDSLVVDAQKITALVMSA